MGPAGDVNITEELAIVTSAMPAMSKRTQDMIEFMGAAGFIFINDAWEPVAYCFDTLSMSALYNEDHVPDPLPDGWRWDSIGGSVKGAGDLSSPSKGRLLINKFKFTNNGTVGELLCSVIKFPKPATIIIGSYTMLDAPRAYDILPDLQNFRVYVIALGEIVRLDWLHKVVSRLCMEPVNILSFFGGIEPQIAVLKELGFRIRQCFSIEVDPSARATSAALYPEVIHSGESDMHEFEANMLPDNITWYAATGGPPCQASSQRNTNPSWDTSNFESMQSILEPLQQTNPNMHVLFENVVPHSTIAGIREDWDSILGIQSQQHNALLSGSIAKRNRLYWSNTIDLSKLRPVTHRCPEVVFQAGWTAAVRPLPTLMARGVNTQRPPMACEFGTQRTRHMTADERDRVNPGLKAGASGTGSEAERNIGNGNAFSADVLWHIAREWEVKHSNSPVYSLMTADDLYACAASSPDKLEHYFMTMDTTATKGDRPAAILQYFMTFAMKYGKVKPTGLLQMPKLDLIVNDTQTIPHQVNHPCDVPAHLAASAEYAMLLMQRDGTHERVTLQPHFWVCMLFFQPKGRKVIADCDGELFKNGDELEALRPLKDMRPINSATSDCIPAQWGDWSPDRGTAHEEIPPGTTHFKKHDSSNAYHSVELTDRTSDLSVCRARLARRIEFVLRCLCGSQGQAAMGTFYPAWSAYGNCFFVGMAWMQWWIEHIDDVLCHATDSLRCQLRFEIMYCIKQMMGLPATLKYDNVQSLPTPKEEHVGFLWTPNGHCIGDKSMEFLCKLLAKPPKGGQECLRLRGSLNQCLTAFDWSTSETHFILNIMKPLNDCIKVWQATKKYSWGTEQQDSMDVLVARMSNQPRKFTHPSFCCSEQRCLIGQGDWDPNGVSWHLLSVAVPDAAMVTPEMLLDPDMCILIAFHPKHFNTCQKKWHTFEGEMFAHIHGLRKCIKYINKCMAQFTAKRPYKYGWGSDSTVTIYRLPKITLPETKMDYLSAKIQRFIGWSEEAAVTRYWPTCRLHVPGKLNCLADASVRIVKQLMAAYPGMVEQDDCDVDRDNCEADDIYAMPLAIHTYAAAPAANATSFPRIVGMPIQLPQGTAAYTMLFTAADYETIEQAYADDMSEYCGVKLSEVYAAVYSVTSLNSLTLNRVKQWKDRIFYPVRIAADATLEQGDWNVLYTPSMMSRNIQTGPIEYPDLVLVIPDKCMVRISNVPVTDFPFKASKSCADWADWYLRDDLMWIAHNCKGGQHASLALTIATLKEQAHWPGMEEDARKHIDQCAVCLPLMISRVSVNLGQYSDQRFKVLQIDDYVLPPEIQRLTGYVSVLTMAEPAAGATVFALRTTKLAREVCLLVHTRWVPHYGTPLIISSDLDPALIGHVITFMCSSYGIPDRINTVLGLKCPLVEHQNNYLSESLHQAEARGDLTNAEGLAIAVANAQIKATQFVKTDKATVFERLHGTKANTVSNLLNRDQMTIDQITDAIIKAKPEDGQFIKRIDAATSELIAFHNAKQDSRARWNACNNLAKQANHQRTDFGFAVGQKVAVGEKVYTVLDIPTVAANVPVIAMLWDAAREEATPMLLSKLRPLAVDRHQVTNSETLPTTVQDAKIGELLFYESETSGLLAGTVLEIVDTSITVQINQPVPNANTWLLRWEDPKKLEAIIRRKAQPAGCTPFTDTFDIARVVARGAFTGPGMVLTDATIYHLKAMGYETSMKDQEMYTAAEAALCLTLQDTQFGRPVKDTEPRQGMGGA